MNPKWNLYFLGWISTVAMAEIQFGYLIGEHSLIKDVLPWIYKFDGSKWMRGINGLVRAMGPFGAALGALIAGPLSYKGRRTCLLIANIIVIISWFIRMIREIIILIIARFIYGLGVGIISVIVPLFIIEISPIKVKGSYGVLCQLGISSGIIIAYLFGFPARNFMPPDDGEDNYWRDYHNSVQMNINLNFIFPVIPAILQIIWLLFFFKLDTPKYYMIKEDWRNAKLSYNKIHPPLSWYQYSTSISDIHDFEEYDVLDSIDANKDGRTYRSLLKPRYRRPFLVGVMLITIQQLSGINLIILFSSKIVFIHPQNTFKLTYLIGAINLAVTVAAIVLYRFAKMKTALLVGILTICACHCMIFSIYAQAIYLEENNKAPDTGSIENAIMAFLIIIVIAFALTLGPITWIYLPEIMTEIGLSIAVAIHWFIIIFISYLPTIGPLINFQDYYLNYMMSDITVFFFIFSGWWVVGFFLIALFIKETQGMSPKEILYMYQDQSYNPLTES